MAIHKTMTNVQACGLVSCFLVGLVHPATADSPLRDVVKKYCVKCHNPETKKGKVDLQSILSADVNRHTELWDTGGERYAP